eukprot:185263_1
MLLQFLFVFWQYIQSGNEELALEYSNVMIVNLIIYSGFTNSNCTGEPPCINEYGSGTGLYLNCRGYKNCDLHQYGIIILINFGLMVIISFNGNIISWVIKNIMTK